MSHCWKNVLIKPTSSLLDALEIINNEALRVVLVVDDNDHLLGVVTDGLQPVAEGHKRSVFMLTGINESLERLVLLHNRARPAAEAAIRRATAGGFIRTKYDGALTTLRVSVELNETPVRPAPWWIQHTENFPNVL